MGSVPDLDEILEPFKVRNRWQRSLVQFLWEFRLHEDVIVLRGLWCTYCMNGKRRLTNIEAECRRFRKYNRAFVYAEYEKLEKKSVEEMKDYLTKLLEQKHYLLAFNVCELIIHEELPACFDILVTMLDCLDSY